VTELPSQALTEEATPGHPVTEDEIEAAERLRARGEFQTVLALTQDMLKRVEDGDMHMRLLFDLVSCSASLDRPELIEAAMDELKKLPKPEFSRVLANLDRAWAETSLGRPLNALNILDIDLATGLFEAEDMRIHKYRLLLFKGEALLHLRLVVEALEWLDRAHRLYPTIESTSSVQEAKIFGWVEPSIQIKRANCLLGLDRYEDSFHAAEEVMKFHDAELATLALQYMAECRVWQGRVPEALGLYADLKKRLPCRLIDEDRIEKGIANCASYLEKRRPPSKPS
jgi:tetratricopeptide (TPR) repeat protein